MWEIIEQVLYGKEESEGRDDGKIEGGKKWWKKVKGKGAKLYQNEKVKGKKEVDG